MGKKFTALFAVSERHVVWAYADHCPLSSKQNHNSHRSTLDHFPGGGRMQKKARRGRRALDDELFRGGDKLDIQYILFTAFEQGCVGRLGNHAATKPRLSRPSSQTFELLDDNQRIIDRQTKRVGLGAARLRFARDREELRVSGRRLGQIDAFFDEVVIVFRRRRLRRSPTTCGADCE